MFRDIEININRINIEFKGYIENTKNNGKVHLVFRCDGERVGNIILDKIDQDKVFLNHLEIVDKHRRRGIETQIIENLVDSGFRILGEYEKYSEDLINFIESLNISFYSDYEYEIN